MSTFTVSSLVPPSDEDRLQGTWVLVGVQRNGRRMGRPGPDERMRSVTFAKDRVTWETTRAVEEGNFEIDETYSPRQIDLALGFEGMFRLPGDRPPLLRVTDVDVPGATIRALIAGQGPAHVICLHGLGSNKASCFATVAALTPEHTVHAIDLPGFGASSKPARAPYDAAYFARAVIGYMDATGLERAHLVGNSMGGRIALEVALDEPDRASTVTLLSPALAFRKRRSLVPLVKLVRPELAAIPHPIRAAQVRAQFWSLFARPERLDPATADIAADEFCPFAHAA